MIPEPRQYTNQLELWKPVIGYEDYYQVSNLGKIKRIASGRSTKIGNIIGGYIIEDGYLRVSLSKDGKWKGLLVHRIVAEAFLGKPPSDNQNEVNHINSIRDDNRVENLEWVTRKENVNHSFQFGFNSKKGEKNPRAKLDWGQVTEIRVLASNGASLEELANKYNVSKPAIWKIVVFRTWKKEE